MRIEQPRSVYDLAQFRANQEAANDVRRVHFADELVTDDIRPTLEAARLEAALKAQRPASVYAQDTREPMPPARPDPVPLRVKIGKLIGKLSVGCGLILMPSFVAIWPMGPLGLAIPAGILAFGLAAHFLSNFLERRNAA